MNLLKRALCLALALALPLCALSQEALTPQREQELYTLSKQLLDCLRAGDEEQALDMMDDTMRGALTGQVGGMWAQLTALAGDFEDVGAYRASMVSGYAVMEMTLRFSRMSLLQSTSFDAADKVAGLYITPGEVPQAGILSEGIWEEAIVVDAGTGFPLEGLLTLPEGEPIAGVVLVHGSGPSNRDEAVGANTPFRDLAHGLAARGFAVARYDKRTFAHGARMAQDADFPRLTVEEETVQDAAAALALVKQHAALQGKPVFLLGHSMGAMLASYIGACGGEPAGYILLAGTPRKLWRMSLQQNLALADELEQAGDAAQAARIRAMAAEHETKALALSGLSDEDALNPNNNPFGISAWYLRHLEGIDAAALHLMDSKPVLVLQGESDRQVTMADYALWQEALNAHPDAAFISYPNLNHLMGAYQGPTVPLSQLVAVEYAQRTPVAEQVMDDIAVWLTQQAD